MQKSVLIGLFMLTINAAIAQNLTENYKPNNTTLSITPTIGYSISKTTFNIAGNELGKNPNVLSELIWDPTNALEYGVDLKLAHRKFVLNADLTFNKTLLGNVSDIDYGGDNRTQPYSTLYLSNHKGLGYSIKIQPGYEWSKLENLSLTTYLSLDLTSRSLYILNDNNWRSNERNYIAGLNSYYKYKFPNYGIGLALDYNLSPQWSTQIAIEGAISKYYAYGNWNLIEEFEKPISYEHKGNGKKVNTSLGLAYTIHPRTSLAISYNLDHFNVTNGKDYLYSKSSGILKARLNEANETKHAFLFGLRYTLPLANAYN